MKIHKVKANASDGNTDGIIIDLSLEVVFWDFFNRVCQCYFDIHKSNGLHTYVLQNGALQTAFFGRVY